MHIKLTIFLLVILSFVIIAFWDRDYINISPQEPLQTAPVTTRLMDAPNIVIPTVKGETTLHEIDASLILVNFWASWCAPCMTEFPSMINLVEQSNGNIALVAISADQNNQDYLNFIKMLEEKFNLPVKNKNIFWIREENKEISEKLFGVKQIPETIIINKNRKIIDKVVGASDWTSSEMRTKLNLKF